MHRFQTIQHSTVQIDLGAINHNCTVIRNLIGEDCALCAVVKADGYGLGAVRVATQLGKHAEMLAVYSPDEAGEVLSAGISTPVLVLAPMYSVDRYHPMYSGVASGQLHLVLHGEDQLRSLFAIANLIRRPLNVHIKIDTGLHRGGCQLSSASLLIAKVVNDTRLRLTGIFTHFVSAVNDEALTRLQHDRLSNILHGLGTSLPADCIVHEANTAATVQWNWTHRDMVRVGLAWTGSVPNGIASPEAFKPVVSWQSRIAHVKNVFLGDGVGYSGKWVAQRPSRIGIVPVGYAAGYPMEVGAEGERKGAYVRVLDEQCNTSLGDAPVIGSVCMDQIAIDLTDIQSSDVGCAVELISKHANSKATLERIAQVAGIVPHAIISRISPKVHRVYLEASHEVVTPELNCKQA
jgi:alanine racemase